jgi:FkbM family methyltransferase
MKFELINKAHSKYIRFITNATGVLEKILYEPKLVVELNKIAAKKEKILILDVGANRGQSIKIFRKIFKNSNILAFEPAEKVYKKLEENFSMLQGVQVFNFGFGEKSGTVKFYESALDETSTMIYPETSSSYFKLKKSLLLLREKKMFNETEVQIKTLDQFILENSLGTIDLLKIDVEGFELEVLRGAADSLRVGKFLNIQLERHEDNMRINQSNDVSLLLNTHGYKLSNSIKHSFGNFYEDFWYLSAD